MSIIGLITNPLSTLNKKSGSAFARALAGNPAVRIAEFRRPEDLPPAIEGFAAEGIGTICVDGGDGTVSAVMTEILRRPDDGWQPRLAVLAGGMLNLIAQNYGTQGDRLDAVRRLAATGDDPVRLAATTIERPVLELRTGGEAPRAGCFFGAAGVHDATRLAHDRLHPAGAKRSAAAGMSIAGTLLSVLFRRGEGSLHAGRPLRLEVDGSCVPGERRLFLVVSTLDHLILGLWPFWDQGEGGMRYIDCLAPPRCLSLALPTFFTGRPWRWMRERGYAGGRARQIAIWLDTPMVLDGEIVVPEPGKPVRLTAERTLRFVKV
ncbi:MAG: hypothetical protein KIT81_02260 [Alphaproteobacteria bacterium]|nr:hypothetical protein [Alphaproteobacteria bacterium]